MYDISEWWKGALPQGAQRALYNFQNTYRDCKVSILFHMSTESLLRMGVEATVVERFFEEVQELRSVIYEKQDLLKLEREVSE